MAANIFTVDVEDWFHILDFEETKNYNHWLNYESRIEKNLIRILKICAEHNIKGTFFILGWIAEHYPELISLIVSYGHQIACHSDKHKLVYDSALDPDQRWTTGVHLRRPDAATAGNQGNPDHETSG